MDTYCTYCGEPWDVGEVADDPSEFIITRGQVIVGCPSCATPDSTPGHIVRLPRAEKHPASDVLYSLAELAGNWADFATDMDTFGQQIFTDPVFHSPPDDEPQVQTDAPAPQTQDDLRAAILADDPTFDLDGERVDARAFLDANRDGFDLVDLQAIYALRPGETLMFGGGAAGVFILDRI